MANARPRKHDPSRTTRVRRRDWDYRQGTYFITIMANRRRHIFGEVRNGIAIPNELGRLVETAWVALSTLPWVELDLWVVMPNHFHAIIRMVPSNDLHPAQGLTYRPQRPDTLMATLGRFKAEVSRTWRQTDPALQSNKVWQDSFWDCPLNSSAHTDRVRAYIFRNPETWAKPWYKRKRAISNAARISKGRLAAANHHSPPFHRSPPSAARGHDPERRKAARFDRNS